MLALVVALVFGRIVGHDFVGWDDQGHIGENPHLDPIRWSSLARFWREPYFMHYVPVSYTVFTGEAWLAESPRDEYGQPQFHPALFHVTSLLLHAACVLLCYQLLLAIVNRPVAALMGATLFALHPLQVESVAWVSEQRGLLAAMFTFLSLLAYLRFGKGLATEQGNALEFQQTARSRATGGWGWYALATLAYLLALLSKPSGVNGPLLAAVLDLFLLRRSWRVSLAALLPWLAAAAAMFTITKQQQPDALLAFQTPLWARPLVAGDALQFYLTKYIWPLELLIQYPRSPPIVLGQAWVYVAWFVPLAIGLLCWRFRANGPWLLCAAWFVAVLLPVLGLAPFAYQHYSTVADRYAYLATFAPALALAWCVKRRPSGIAIAWTSGLLAVLGALAFQQTGRWRDNEALFTYTIDRNPASDVAYGNWGSELLRRGQYVEALQNFDVSMRINPASGVEKIGLNRGLALLSLGRLDEAIAAYEQTLAEFPKSNPAHLNLSAAYFQKQDWVRTVDHARAALKLEPDSLPARFNLALALERLGRKHEALEELRTLLEYHPHRFEAHMKLASLLQEQGNLSDALSHFAAGVSSRPDDRAARFDYAVALELAGETEQALREFRRLLAQASPDFPTVAGHAAWLLATSTNDAVGHRNALSLAEAACQQTEHRDAACLRAKAAALAALKQFEAAEKTAGQAREAAVADSQVDLVRALDEDREQYRQGQMNRIVRPLSP